MFFLRKRFHLVIVCTANRTRSAYFAEYFRHYLSQYRPGALKRIKITSAGTKARTGGRVNDVVALIARNNGFSLRRHASEPLSARMVKRASLILVMEQEHKSFILGKWPEATDKVFRLMEYGWPSAPEDGAQAEVLDVPDPTGRTADDFKAFVQIAHIEADRLAHELVHRGII